MKDDELSFLPDLNKMPWLANSKRLEEPSYQVIGNSKQYEKYVGQYVQIEAEALGTIVDGSNGKKKYVVVLKIRKTPHVLR